ncbi:histone-fold-containing protein [Aaosphaeria arxii CBS 175.79]|uniref:DNA polymerase epsilon subunit D n=1 Tax=Aaosphaeria arxii CBS 175.79 TaxID=1450172 RepID=A0A6A5Y118_9PLEO|nr:histone-fold-containing protein [Aaosphaeria arxii CBS 175.79]KAF2018767.1 histone-fold-containing protein [Aaosphaeria arxii CBS 175.79]
MPPKKSNASASAPEEPTKPAVAASKEDGISVEDLNLPKSAIQRLAKGVLPPSTQIQKDALLAMSKSATVFVNYLTSHAAENATRNGKKTVMPKDIFEAMQELELEAFLPRLEAEVNKFTAIQADKRNSYRKKVRDDKKDPKDGEEAQPRATGNKDNEDSPPTKRVRRSSMDNGEHAMGSDEEGDAGETVDEAEQDDDEVEDDEVDEEPAEEGLTEDLLEERAVEPSDDDMADGDESD